MSVFTECTDDMRSVLAGGTVQGWLPDSAVVLWRRMLGILGDVNQITDPENHVLVYEELSRILDTLHKVIPSFYESLVSVSELHFIMQSRKTLTFFILNFFLWIAKAWCTFGGEFINRQEGIWEHEEAGSTHITNWNVDPSSDIYHVVLHVIFIVVLALETNVDNPHIQSNAYMIFIHDFKYEKLASHIISIHAYFFHRLSTTTCTLYMCVSCIVWYLNLQNIKK